jgi:hypothetical protein
MSDMWGHELAENKAAFRFVEKIHAAPSMPATASARIALRHSHQPQNALKKKKT